MSDTLSNLKKASADLSEARRKALVSWRDDDAEFFDRTTTRQMIASIDEAVSIDEETRRKLTATSGELAAMMARISTLG